MATNSNDKKADEKETSPSLELKYVRRLDRTPEKDYHLRDDEIKKNSSISRSLVANVRKKISQLEDAVEERTQEVETERQLRKQAEEILRYKDMYKNPEVNQELRDRLPRANKSDPFKKEEVTETDNSSIEEDIVTEEESQSLHQPRMDPDSLKSLESQKVGDGDVRPQTAPVSKRNLKFSDDLQDHHNSTSTQTAQFERSPSSFPRTSLTQPPHSYYGHAFGANPYMPFSGSFLPNGAYHSPLLHSTSMFSQSPMFRPMSTPALNTAVDMHIPPLSQRLSQSYSAPSETSPNNPDRSLNMESASKITTGATGGQTSPERSGEHMIGSASNLSGSRTFLQSQRSPLHIPLQTSALPDPFIPNISQRLNSPTGSNYGTEYSRHIMSLLNEIDLQRTEKKKMMEKLVETEQELDSLKLTMKANIAEKQASASETDKAAGLVQEVYTAQKKRDEAIDGRLKKANEERDDVMTRLRELEHRLDAQRRDGYAGSEYEQQLDEDQSENEDFSFLMSQLDSPSLAENESALVHKIEAVQQRQREVTNEEMQIVMDQRDVALAKCKKYESELLHYEKQLDADGGTDKNLKAKLSTLQQERDMAVAKSKQLDQEIQTLRLYYSLHKSLSTENTLQQQANNTIHAYEEELGAVKQEVEHVQKENNHLVSQLRATTIDKKQLQEALETTKRDKERLQRLATVLKRKLNDMNKDHPEEEQS